MHLLHLSSLVFRSPRPFHPQRLWDLIGEGFRGAGGVLRVKGFCRLASRPSTAALWSQAGPVIRLEPFATVDDASPEGQELVFIGTALRHDTLHDR
ncbi:GTP-binding protein [Actinocorallia herbida]|uniref:GTP-binding protein n=1 Tax=Actinocorallia herbida TaxID=58109 RepID=UPI001B861D95|nr:GTP-binding protein [Actinocorallia herbida]